MNDPINYPDNIRTVKICLIDDSIIDGYYGGVANKKYWYHIDGSRLRIIDIKYWKEIDPNLDNRIIKVLCQAFLELNTIRARDGIPYKSDVDPIYFSSIVDELDSVVKELTGKSAHCHPSLSRV